MGIRVRYVPYAYGMEYACGAQHNQCSTGAYTASDNALYKKSQCLFVRQRDANIF